METVERTLESTRCPATCLELEVTENAIMREEQASRETLRRLNLLGVRLSIDNFGIGYSSLHRLKHLPIHSLKIDRSFVNDLSSEGTDAAIVTGIITMAHGMGLRVVAEGVETREQFDELSAGGCDEMQGYYFSPPRPPEELAGLLAGSQEWAAPPRSMSP